MKPLSPQSFLPSALDASPALAAVVAYAREAHRGQERDDGAPFIVHPLEAAALLASTGHRESVIAAGLLHDAVENSDVAISDLALRFGDEVAGLVAALTEDDGIASPTERKRLLREQVAARGPEAAAVYAADKVSKVRELRGLALTGGGGPGRARMDHYRLSLAMLERRAPAHPLVHQLRRELEAL